MKFPTNFVLVLHVREKLEIEMSSDVKVVLPSVCVGSGVCAGCVCLCVGGGGVVGNQWVVLVRMCGPTFQNSPYSYTWDMALFLKKCVLKLKSFFWKMPIFIYYLTREEIY